MLSFKVEEFVYLFIFRHKESVNEDLSLLIQTSIVGHDEGYNMTVESIHSKAHARLAHNITDIHSESQRRLTVIFGNSEILQRITFLSRKRFIWQ